jgi:hypothetical protein
MEKSLSNIIEESLYNEVKSRIISENKTKGHEVYHITCEGEPVDSFESEEIAMKHLDIYKKKHPEKEFIIEKKTYDSPSEMIDKLDEMSGDEDEKKENKKMKKVKVSSLAEAAFMAKQKNSDKFKFNGKEYNLNEYWKLLEEEETLCNECKQGMNEENDVEESNAFILAADAARDDGKEEFEFPKGSGKMHKVTIKKDIEEEKHSCNECGGELNEEGMCNECGSGTMKESKKVKLRLTESELVSMIKKMVEKSKINESKNESVPGLEITNRVKNVSKKENDDNIKNVEEKLKKISTFDGNDNPEFPKQIGKGEKMAINNTEKQDEIVADNRGGGMEDLNYEYEPSEKFKKRLKMSLEGDSKMGNSQEAANVIKTKTGENLEKKAERKKEKQSKEFEVSWGHKWKSPVDIKESEKPKMETIINEEIKRMKKIIGYDEKTQ